MYQLGETLHKTIQELGKISSEEFVNWMGYFREKQRRMKEEDADLKAEQARLRAERGLL